MIGQRAGGCGRPGLFSLVAAGHWQVLVVLALAVSSLTSCGAPDQRSSAAPPWVVCDTTLADSAAGAVVTDATMPARTLRVSYETVGGIALLTSRDCDHGATLSIAPSEAALVTKSAPTNDGKIAGATISPRRAQFMITVRHPDGTTTVVKVDLAGPPPT
jgi:hypothetical protein